jgi:Protein of unknown function (DUF2384)
MEQRLAVAADQSPVSFLHIQRSEPECSLGALTGLPAVQFGSEPAPPAMVMERSGQIAMQQLVPEAGKIGPVLHVRITGPVRLIQRVAEAWSLSKHELATLLAYSSPRAVDNLLAGRLMFDDNDDRADRALLLYLIHNTLSDRFIEPHDEKTWIRSPLPQMGNIAPLKYMLTRRIPGMMTVRDFVEQRLANR